MFRTSFVFACLYYVPTPVCWLLSGIAITTITVMLIVFFFQGYLIYMPNFPPGSRTDVWTPARFGMAFEQVTVIAKDGTKTAAYYIPATHKSSCKYAVILCHANAGNLGHRIPIVRRLRELMDCAVFMPSYRGYGLSEGTPNETGIKQDVQAGLDWFVQKLKDESLHFKDIKFIAFGQSLGGAVAINLVATNADLFSGLIVENTFLSIPDLVPHVMPVFKHFTWLCRQRWLSKERMMDLKSSKVRLLILCGTADTLIPPSHSKGLLEIAKKVDVDAKLVELKGGDHNDTVLKAGYFEAVDEFIKSL